MKPTQAIIRRLRALLSTGTLLSSGKGNADAIGARLPCGSGWDDFLSGSGHVVRAADVRGDVEWAVGWIHQSAIDEAVAEVPAPSPDVRTAGVRTGLAPNARPLDGQSDQQRLGRRVTAVRCGWRRAQSNASAEPQSCPTSVTRLRSRASNQASSTRA